MLLNLFKKIEQLFFLYIGSISYVTKTQLPLSNWDILKDKKGYSVYLTKESRKKLIELTNQNKFFIHINDKGFSSNSIHINKFSIRTKDIYIGAFELSGFHGCCGVCILSGVHVTEMLRHQGVGSIIHELAEKIASVLGYGCIICTDKQENVAENSILSKKDFKKIHTFINPRTDNILNIHAKSLNQEEPLKRKFNKVQVK